MYPNFKEENSRLWLKFWRCSCTFEHINVDATGETLIGVQKYLMIFVYHPFPAERKGSSVVSQIKSKLLLFVDVAVTQQILHQSWCRRLQKGAFSSSLVLEVMFPGARQGMLAAAERLQHNGMKGVVLRLCQGRGCSVCAGAVFCIRVYCLSAFFLLIKGILSPMAFY